MSYLTVIEIVNSGSLMSRIVACAASEDIPDPQTWVDMRKWEFASQPGWSNDWAYAKDTATINQNPDIGARDDVINDAKILTAVQALNTPDTPAGG
jgi:hypothetical protein